MREILFRGKPLGYIDNAFIYGSLGVISTDLVAIYQCKEFAEDDITLVDIGTVGQYTGLTDKNGKKIFEGDIVKTECDLWHGENKKERVTRIGVVVYDEKSCQFGLNIKAFSKCFTLKRWKGDYNEIIGNIHDNPELLQKDDAE